VNRITFNKLDDINKAAQQFLLENKGVKQFAFYGNMGVGKTTFIKELCKILFSEDEVTSPTFSLINEYHTKMGDKIYHFDFYRINDIEEVYNIGYEDYFYSNNYCFVEWPELIEELIPDTMLKVSINMLTDDSREIIF